MGRPNWQKGRLVSHNQGLCRDAIPPKPPGETRGPFPKTAGRLSSSSCPRRSPLFSTPSHPSKARCQAVSLAAFANSHVSRLFGNRASGNCHTAPRRVGKPEGAWVTHSICWAAARSKLGACPCPPGWEDVLRLQGAYLPRPPVGTSWRPGQPRGGGGESPGSSLGWAAVLWGGQEGKRQKEGPPLLCWCKKNTLVCLSCFVVFANLFVSVSPFSHLGMSILSFLLTRFVPFFFTFFHSALPPFCPSFPSCLPISLPFSSSLPLPSSLSSFALFPLSFLQASKNRRNPFKPACGFSFCPLQLDNQNGTSQNRRNQTLC